MRNGGWGGIFYIFEKAGVGKIDTEQGEKIKLTVRRVG